MHVGCRPTLPVIQFVLGVHPMQRHALRNGIEGVTGRHHPIVLATVSHSPALTRFFTHNIPLFIEVEAVAVLLSAPQEPDHWLVLFPAGEGIVGGVDDHNAAAVANVLDEILLYTLRPGLAVVV